MKIAIIANSSWNIWNFRMDLAKALLENGFEVAAISPIDEFTNNITAAGIPHIPIELDTRGSNPIKDLKLIRDFYRTFKRNNFNLALQFTIKPNIYGTVAAKLAGTPVINNVSGLGTVFLHKNLTSYIAKKLYKLAFHHPAKVFFQNNDDRELFIRNNLIDEEKTGLVPGSGIAISKFNFKPKDKGEVFTFLLAARILHDKGIKEYIKAADAIKKEGFKVIFKLAGANDDNPKLGIPAKEIMEWHNKDTIDYIGFKENLKEIMAEADCVVLPSYREGTPKTLIEAAAIGRPIVTTDVPGCREIVKDGLNGYLCHKADYKDLADKMKMICKLPEEKLKEMGKASRQLAEDKFDVKLVIERYLWEINRILS